MSTCRRISIDSIRLRCEANCYLSVKELLNDLKRLIAWNQVYRAGSIRSFKYLHTLSKNIDALVASRDLVNRFLEYKMNDFQTLTKH